MIYKQQSISLKCYGVSTVENNTIRKDAGFDGKLDLGNAGIATVARNLMNADEIIRMNNDLQIIILRGEKPLICKKFDYSEYWMAEKIEEIEIKKYKKKISLDNVKIMPEEKLPTFEEFIKVKKGGVA